MGKQNYLLVILCYINIFAHSLDQESINSAEFNIVDTAFFTYDFPVSEKGSVHGFYISASLPNLAYSLFQGLEGASISHTNIYGGYCYIKNNQLKVSVGLGYTQIRSGDEHVNGTFLEYRNAISLPLSVAVGRKGYDKFGLKIGGQITPFVNIYTEHYDKKEYYSDEDNTIYYKEVSYNGYDVSGGVVCALLPELIWYSSKIPISMTLTILSPSITIAPWIFTTPTGVFTLNTGFSIDFLRSKETHKYSP